MIVIHDYYAELKSNGALKEYLNLIMQLKNAALLQVSLTCTI